MSEVVSLAEYRKLREMRKLLPVVPEGKFWSSLAETGNGAITPQAFRINTLRICGLPVVTDASLPRGSWRVKRLG